MSDLIAKLNWRYATKKYNPAKVLEQDKLDRILEAIRLAPTSSGLQPFEVLVVKNPDLRAKIRAVAWNQQGVSEASHLLVFAAWDDITEERIDMMFDMTNEQRGFINEGWEAYRKQLKGIVASRTLEQNAEAAARQVYIALGLAMVAAAFEEVDSTPMEGFDPKAVDEILGLGERKLKSVVILPLGYREAEGDWLAGLKKVRRPMNQVVSEIA
ncbi:nitroreductase [Duganella sp. 3397]|uniref:Oxygen-insensitive NAD(P)H nitroreductase n=1 Tax=Duganella phyllosphaerae TaxID=762836 RepID=A0A1E7W7J6_9BURK|nr:MULTISPECIES: NAD(P)H-dependent oxidoreductase [Duganella]MDR7051796.1 nitroreductase [Duganella sp. 3397]OEZ92087.1 oxygen-insensitive NAD(P)H nitroreductase [Duganella phyllosphaerae]